MLSYSEALQAVLNAACPLGTETVALSDSCGRVLAQEVVAPFPFPRFDNSAVDGYAVRFGAGEGFRVMGEIRAGQAAETSVEPGEACRIFTGAPVPESADAVVMQEDCNIADGLLCVSGEVTAGQHIRREGEEIRQGQVVLGPGRLVAPPVVGVLASCGLSSVHCFKRPRVSVLVTGDELVQPGASLGPGQIYESNSWGLAAALTRLGLETLVARSRDDLEGLTIEAAKCLENSDMLVCCGGASVGEHDLVRPALEALGVRQEFWRVAIKPGMPLYFGKKGDKLVFGLPGNPVSALVNHLLFVRPVLLRQMGFSGEINKTYELKLASNLRKKAGRMEFVRATRMEDEAKPLSGQGSHMLGGLAEADGLILFPAELTELKQGATVQFMPLQWGYPE